MDLSNLFQNASYTPPGPMQLPLGMPQTPSVAPAAAPTPFPFAPPPAAPQPFAGGLAAPQPFAGGLPPALLQLINRPMPPQAAAPSFADLRSRLGPLSTAGYGPSADLRAQLGPLGLPNGGFSATSNPALLNLFQRLGQMA